jgi:hypothetical protein
LTDAEKDQGTPDDVDENATYYRSRCPNDESCWEKEGRSFESLCSSETGGLAGGVERAAIGELLRGRCDSSHAAVGSRER